MILFLEEIDGALIHVSSGTLVPVGTGGTVRTYVVVKIVRRGCGKTIYDIWCKFMVKLKPISAETEEDRVVLTINRNGKDIEISTKLLTSCDGAHSWTSVLQNGSTEGR